MRKITVFFIALCLCGGNVYPFWIWSPKKGEWKNPKYSPYADPKLQLEKGNVFFESGDYRRALKSFQRLLAYYPDAQEAAEAQYFLARCYKEIGDAKRAFDEYEKLIKSYPNSDRIQDAVAREYAIGEYFLERKETTVLGVPLSLSLEHPAAEIFRTIADTSPYSSFAPKALYQLGMFYMNQGRFEEAKETFAKLIDTYPESDTAVGARYQLAMASSKASSGTDYDATHMQDARQRLEEFLKNNPDMGVSKEAAGKLKELNEQGAKKNFDVASFYERRHKPQSALVYYRIVTETYAETSYAPKAQERIRAITGVSQ